MKQVINNHRYHDAIHELYLVKSKPKTLLKAFYELEHSDLNEFQQEVIWQFIERNTEYLGEVEFPYSELPRGTYWMNKYGEPNKPVFYDGRLGHYKILANVQV